MCIVSGFLSVIFLMLSFEKVHFLFRYYKMATRYTVRHHALVASKFEETKSITLVQRWWRATMGQHETLSRNLIQNIHNKLFTTGSVLNKKRDRQKKVTQADNVNVVEHILLNWVLFSFVFLQMTHGQKKISFIFNIKCLSLNEFRIFLLISFNR